MTLAAGLTALATSEPDGGPSWLLVALISFNITWLALASWQVVLGFGLNRKGADRLNDLERQLTRLRSDAEISARAAVLLTIHNEDPDAVFARARIMADALGAAPGRSAIEIFVLSDTQDPAVARAEEIAFARLPADGSSALIYYRRRAQNIGRKAGNIGEFCASHGDRFDYMIILDADSLMTASTISLLVQVMAANPRIAILQTVSYPANLETLFARIHQFAAHLYTPLSMRGLDFWQGSESNYWGHNAILRIDAYRAHCELPILPGRPPLGGEILCHDTVEGALLHRAGWEARLLPELDGSWEEMPANLVDFARRSRRWCQGNLQHVPFLRAPGLPWPSRLHLAIGIGTYASGPLWLLIGALALVAPLQGGDAATAALGVAAVIALVSGTVLVPKILSIATVLADPERRRRFGGAGRLLASAALEQLHATVTWPALMVFYTQFVVTTLTGRVVPWDAQPRGNRVVAMAEALRRFRLQVVLGAAVAAITLAFDATLFAYAAPLCLSLLLSPAITAWTSRVGPGRLARRLGLFLTPDETAPAPELRALRDALASSGEPPLETAGAEERGPYGGVRSADAARAGA